MGYFKSAIGRKQFMAITGLAWSLFVLTHMLGNLLIFVSADAYNKYSHALISNPFLIVAEAGLLITILYHVVNGFWLTIENRKARSIKNAMPTNGAKAARFQSKYMAFHGTLLLVFIILHLITFKYGTHYDTVVDGITMRDLHRLVIEVFQSPIYVAWYAVALVAIGFHLAHGFYSGFATLGAFHPKYSPALNKFGYVYAFVIAAGFLSQPIYVFFIHR